MAKIRQWCATIREYLGIDFFHVKVLLYSGTGCFWTISVGISNNSRAIAFFLRHRWHSFKVGIRCATLFFKNFLALLKFVFYSELILKNVRSQNTSMQSLVRRNTTSTRLFGSIRGGRRACRWDEMKSYYQLLWYLKHIFLIKTKNMFGILIIRHRVCSIF